MPPFVVTLSSVDARRTRVSISVAGPSGIFYPVAFLIDGGADISLITRDTARLLGIVPGGAQASARLSAVCANGSRIPYEPHILHVCVVSDDDREIYVSVQGGIAGELESDLLGTDFLDRFTQTKRNRTLMLSAE